MALALHGRRWREAGRPARWWGAKERRWRTTGRTRWRQRPGEGGEAGDGGGGGEPATEHGTPPRGDEVGRIAAETRSQLPVGAKPHPRLRARRRGPCAWQWSLGRGVSGYQDEKEAPRGSPPPPQPHPPPHPQGIQHWMKVSHRRAQPLARRHGGGEAELVQGAATTSATAPATPAPFRATGWSWRA